MTQLTSDVLLTGFALALGAGPVHIGLLATLPLGLRLSQLFTSTRVARLGRWRTVALVGGAAGRLARFAGLAIAFMEPGDARVWLLLAVVAFSAIGGSLYDLAIVAWMAELVPLRLRGGFFGRRNRAIAAVGLIVTLGAALIIDSLQSQRDAAVPAFAIVCDDGRAPLRAVPALRLSAGRARGRFLTPEPGAPRARRRSTDSDSETRPPDG